MATHNELGKKGEELARRYLKKEGYKIIDENYQTQRAEIDIIAQKGDELVFVEVRTKTNTRFGTPEETINYKKKQKLVRNALGYIHRTDYTGPYRIDAICIILGPNSFSNPSITHYQNITGY